MQLPSFYLCLNDDDYHIQRKTAQPTPDLGQPKRGSSDSLTTLPWRGIGL